MSVLDESLTRLRGTPSAGAYTRAGVSWSAPSKLAFFGSVQPMTSSEDVAPAERVVTRWSMFARGAPDVLAGDRIRREDGTVLEVDGDVAAWRLHWRAHHVEAVLKKVTG